MNRKKAFGTIELLLGMVITAAIFAAMMPALQSMDASTFNQSSLKNPNEEAMQKVNDLSKEIDKLRRAPIDLNGSLN